MRNIDYFPLAGGIDRFSPPLQKKAGRLLDCLNFEQEFGKSGYRRVDGYTPLLGGNLVKAPDDFSSAEWTKVNVTAGADLIQEAGETDLIRYVEQPIVWSPGARMTFAVSIKKGVSDTAIVQIIESDGNSARARFNLAHATVSAVVAEGDVTEPRAGATMGADGFVRCVLSAQTSQPVVAVRIYPLGSIEAEFGQGRSVQAKGATVAGVAVPGAGPIRGVATLGNEVFALRDNAGDELATLWRADMVAQQWVPVKADLQPGGRLRAIQHNFFGTPDKRGLYCVDGKNAPWEITPGSITQFDPGKATDTSSTSIQPSLGAHTFTVSADLAWKVGDELMFFSGGQRMIGTVTDYTGTSLQVDITWLTPPAIQPVSGGVEWTFDSDTESWTAIGGSVSQDAGELVAEKTGGAGNLHVVSPGSQTIDGSVFTRIRTVARADSGATYSSLTVFYTTAGHGFDNAYRKIIPVVLGTSPQEIVADMADLTAGGDDWTENTITQIRFSFGGANDTGTFRFDEVALEGDEPVPLDDWYIFSRSYPWPIDVAAHRQKLWIARPDGQLEGSKTGEPTDWSSDTVAVAVGDDISGIASVKGALAAICRNSTRVLVGSSVTDFELQDISLEAGALFGSVAELGGSLMYLDNPGVTSLVATQAFGNFAPAVLTRDMQELLERRMSLFSGAKIFRRKNQYRLYFSDRSGVTVTVFAPQTESSGAKIACTRFQYDHKVTAVWSAEYSDSTEAQLFGTEDGHVMVEDSGSSFAGMNIYAFARLAFHHFKSPATKKRYHKLEAFLEAEEPIRLKSKSFYDFNDGQRRASINYSMDVIAGGGIWEEDNWDGFLWDAPEIGKASAPIDGVARNLGLFFWLDSSLVKPFTISEVLLHWSARGLAR